MLASHGVWQNSFNLDGIIFTDVRKLTEGLLQECSDLFSAHYARWAAYVDRRGGKRVKLSASAIRRGCLPHTDVLDGRDEHSGVVTARIEQDGMLMGHALYLHFNCALTPGDRARSIVWITQLVVHTDARHRRVATRLLETLRKTHPSASVYGLATSHPYTVMALERALGQRCSTSLAERFGADIMKESYIPYIQDKRVVISKVPKKCIIDTAFDIDHDAVDRIRRKLGASWQLGDLDAGEEHLAMILLPCSVESPWNGPASRIYHQKSKQKPGALQS